MEQTGAVAGSFRDPSGQVHIVEDRVFRSVAPRAMADFQFVRSTDLLNQLVDQGDLISETVVDGDVLGDAANGAALVIEHPKLPFISYPYEWSFAALKDAALLQLRILLTALSHEVMLSDASAFNVQYQGAKPIFIDVLSFRRYREGEFWNGHRQFCEQFLNPLLLRSELGIPHNAWYRGTLEGVRAIDLHRMLPLKCKFSWNILTHVVLQAKLQKRPGGEHQAEKQLNEKRLTRIGLQRILSGLQKWIARLEPATDTKSEWQDYADANTYAAAEADRKRQFVHRFTQSVGPQVLWDIGCNTGDYSATALAAGADRAIGFDSDHGALELAFERAKSERLNFLPIFLDAANPAPSQGWAQTERMGLSERANADAILALAILHHLAIARNVPLRQAVHWLVSLAPNGVIEFVPKSDPMVHKLLQLRDDVFDDYDQPSFVAALTEVAEIVESPTVSASDRRLFWYRRR